MAKADNSHRSKKFSGFSKLLQEICEGFLQDYDAFDKDNSKKNVKFNWMDRCEERFMLLKDLLTSAPVLTLPSGDEGYTVYRDYLYFMTIKEA